MAIYVTDNRYSADNTGATNLKTALSGVKLCYELADSAKFTIQLTPHEIILLSQYAYMSTNGSLITLDYHNGEMASLGDVSQLGETVEKLGEYLERSNANSYVDLTTTTYKFPCDGYVVVDSQAVTSGNIRVQLIAKSGSFVIGGIFMHIVGAYQIQTTYVKAGMQARVTQDVAGVRKRFIPLIE